MTKLVSARCVPNEVLKLEQFRRAADRVVFASGDNLLTVWITNGYGNWCVGVRMESGVWGLYSRGWTSVDKVLGFLSLEFCMKRGYRVSPQFNVLMFDLDKRPGETFVSFPVRNF